jgi:hypothetical protein
MQPVSTAALLDVWERGQTLGAVHRALLLVSAAHPEVPLETLAAWPIGERDRHVFELREQVFGRRIDGFSACPACSEKLELSFATSDLQHPAAQAAEQQVEADGHHVTFRLPNSLDLLEISTADGDVATAETQLLRRCIRKVECRGATVELEAVPTPVAQRVVQQMAEADPQAVVELALACPACSHRWSEPFDIVTFFWREIEVWAQRLLRDVHTLASAYGWTESEILALSPQRRRLYLEMIAGA